MGNARRRWRASVRGEGTIEDGVAHYVYDPALEYDQCIAQIFSNEFDMRLIAAAPEMLEFLRDYVTRNSGHDLDRANVLLARIDGDNE